MGAHSTIFTLSCHKNCKLATHKISSPENIFSNSTTTSTTTTRATMATQQKAPKTAKAHSKRLRDVLPKRGFEYKQRHDLFASSSDTAAFKAALQDATTNFSRPEVDEILAALMKKAKELKKRGDSDHGVVFDRAGKHTEVNFYSMH